MADLPGWGLLDAETRDPIDPVSLVTDEAIEMTPWEVHDLAVQVVRTYLKEQGFQLMSWQGNPEVDPSIWFVGTTGKPEWVVVRAVKYPANRADRPGNWETIAHDCAAKSTTGHFASIAVVSVDQPFQARNEASVPLWRGHGMHVRFTGLEQYRAGSRGPGLVWASTPADQLQLIDRRRATDLVADEEQRPQRQTRIPGNEVQSDAPKAVEDGATPMAAASRSRFMSGSFDRGDQIRGGVRCRPSGRRSVNATGPTLQFSYRCGRAARSLRGW